MPYTKPEDVTSPKKRWGRDHRVLHDEGKGGWSAAEGLWDNEAVLALRWNGDDDTPKGNPQSRGYPTWFIVPDELEGAVREAISDLHSR